MATTDKEKSAQTDSTPSGKAAVSEADKANEEVAAKRAAEEEKGYVGSTSDPHPNDAHSLASGPDSPPLAPDDRTRFDQPAARPEEG